MDDDEDTAARPSPMAYDGGLRIGADPDGYVTLDHRVVVTCDSVRKPGRWTLYRKHGQPPARCRCPACGRWAAFQLDGEEQLEAPPGAWAQVRAALAFPFRRDDTDPWGDEDDAGEQPGLRAGPAAPPRTQPGPGRVPPGRPVDLRPVRLGRLHGDVRARVELG